MDYSGLQSYLKTQAKARTPFVAPVYNEVVNDKAVFEKTVTEGAGTFFLQNAGMSTVKSALKKMNIFTSEESDELLTSLGKGEGKEALKKLAKKLAKKGFKKLSKKISDQADKFRNKGEAPEPPEEEDAANQAGNEIQTQDRPALDEDAERSADNETEPPAPDREEEQEDTPPPDEEEPTEPTEPTEAPPPEEDEDLISAGKKAVAKGLKNLTGIGDDAEEAGSIIGKGLKTAGEIEAGLGGPEDPLGDVISAVVGLGSLIFGGLRKTHKDSYVTPPLPPSTFESFNVQKFG